MEILTRETGLSTEPAVPVTFPLTEEDRVLIEQMIVTSQRIGGYGLAAPQIGDNRQIFVYRTSSTSDKYTVVINPTVENAVGKLISKDEGCLSVPGTRKNIKRFKVFSLLAYNVEGKQVRLRPLHKKEKIILQHEFDHLKGLTILDR